MASPRASIWSRLRWSSRLPAYTASSSAGRPSGRLNGRIEPSHMDPSPQVLGIRHRGFKVQRVTDAIFTVNGLGFRGGIFIRHPSEPAPIVALTPMM